MHTSMRFGCIDNICVSTRPYIYIYIYISEIKEKEEDVDKEFRKLALKKSYPHVIKSLRRTRIFA